MLSGRTAVAVPNMDLLNDKECTTRQKRCCKKTRQEKHGSHSSILARWNNDYKYRNSLSLIGWTEQDIMLFDSIALENHSYITTKAETIRNSTHWILTLNQERGQQPLHQRPDFAQAKRECKRFHDEHMAKTQQDYRTIPRSHQIRQRKRQAFEGIEEYDWTVDPRTSWKFYKESRRPADSFVLVNKLGSKQLEDEQLEFQAFFMVWRFVKKFWVRTSFGWLEKNCQTTDGKVQTEHTLKQHEQMRTVCHNTCWTEWSHFITRIKIAHLCVKIVVSFLPAPDTDHKHKFSLTYLTNLSDVLSLTPKSFGARSICSLRRSTAEWRINTNPVSHRLWAQSDRVRRPRARKNWAWQESWDRSVSNTKENHGRKLPKSPKMWMNLEKLLRCPTSSHRCIPVMTQRKALHTRILKTENYEKCWLLHCIFKTDRIVDHLENQQLQGIRKQQ